MANNFLTAINSPVDPTVPASIGPKLGATLNKGSSNITKAPVSTVTPGMKLLNNAGTYQGKPITAGTDAEVASQMKAIDASTTTQSNSKIIDKVIPENNAKLDTLAEKGITTDQQGNQKFADGTFVGEQPKVTADTADEDTQTQALLDQMKATTDAQTAAQIANIQQQYALRKQQQERLNTQQQARTQNALLMGGVTGQGSSAQYAPISSGGIVSAQENYGIQQLAQLDADENNAISAVKQAQADGDYKLMDEKLSELKDARKAKIDAASKLNDQISANNQKIAEQNQSAEKDNAIADVYAQGITDVPSIMAELRKQGISVTSTDVANSIKSFTPIGLDDLVKTLKQNGAPQEVISKVLASKNMTEAYNNAGDYANEELGL